MVEKEAADTSVRDHYAKGAKAVADNREPSWGSTAEPGVYGASRYDPADLASLPDKAVAGSIGGANPVALVDLRPGAVVLDGGSGGGSAVLLSARRVGPRGKAYGLDMTDEMLELARENQRRAGVENVEFLHGRIEAVPLPDSSVDVVISNCVVNLSTDKPAVFAEMYRVLRPGGRLALADVVAESDVDDDLRSDLTAWADCLGGALTRSAYREGLELSGFREVSITDSHVVADGFASGIVRAVKPRAMEGG